MTETDTFKVGILADSVGPTITPASGILANSFSAAAIPEPSTYAGILGGLAALLALIRRRRS